MPIKNGDKFPAILLKRLTSEGMQDVDTAELLANKKVVIFGLPGAFTPTCSAKHLPGYVAQLEAFKSKGVNEVMCLSVNDPFVMNAWAKANNADGKISFLPDGNGALTRALGLEMDGSGYGLGQRCQRFAMLVDKGVIKHLAVEAPGKFEVSSAEAMLAVA